MRILSYQIFQDEQAPPPLPTSPPPTPAEEIAVVVNPIANVTVLAVPEKEESLIISEVSVSSPFLYHFRKLRCEKCAARQTDVRLS